MLKTPELKPLLVGPGTPGMPVFPMPELKPSNTVPPVAVLKKPEILLLLVPPLAVLKKPEILAPVLLKPD
jgi:hypothetical protein